MSQTICIFSSNYLPNIGGVEKYTQNLAMSLGAMGYKVIIATSNVFDLPVREDLAENVEIVRLPCYKLLGGRLPVSRKNSAYKQEFQRLIDSHIDYVMVNTRFYRHSIEGLKLAKAIGVRPVMVDHGSAYLTLGNALADKVIAAYEHMITAVGKRYNPAYYAVSKLSSTWIKTFGIQSQGELCNSIDAKQFREMSSGRDFRGELGLSDDAVVVSFTGRFSPEKGIVPIVNAARIVADKCPNVRFLLAGDGTLRPLIERENPGNIAILGRIDSSDVAALLLQSDIFCLPTRSEGFSTSLLECAACGTTPVITHVGGVDELMPSDEYGIVLKTTTDAEVSQAIIDLANDPDRRKRCGRLIQSHVEENFSWDVVARKVIEACKEANEE